MLTKFKILFIIVLIIAIISHFLYWVHLDGDRMGVSYWSGRVTLVLLAAALILTITATRKEVLIWANITCGGIGLFILAFLFIDLSQDIKSANFYTNISAPLINIFSLGTLQSAPGNAGFLPGATIAVITEILLLVAGLIMVFTNRKKIQEPIKNAFSVQLAASPLDANDDHTNLVAQLEKLASLREKGVLPEDVYNTEREKILLKMKS